MFSPPSSHAQAGGHPVPGSSGGGTCGGGAAASFTAAVFEKTQTCQSQAAVGCLHGACCVLLLDGSSLTLDDTRRWVLLGLSILWFCFLIGSFVVAPMLGYRHHKGHQPEAKDHREKGECQRIHRRIPTTSKICSTVVLVCIAIVLQDSLCRCAATVSDFSEEALGAKSVKASTTPESVAPPSRTAEIARSNNGQQKNRGRALRSSTQAVCDTRGPQFLGEYGTYAYSIIFGVFFGLLGDLMFPGAPGGHMVMGIIFFAVGHWFYLIAFDLATASILAQFGLSKMASFLQPKMQFQDRPPEEHLRSILLALRVVLMGIAVLKAWKPAFYRGIRGTTPVAWVAFLYSLLVAETAAKGALLAILDPVHFALLGIGCVLFLISDMAIAQAIAHRVTVGPLHISDFVWLTYGPAQCLIVFSSHALWLTTQEKA